jgi:hypothetical protein
LITIQEEAAGKSRFGIWISNGEGKKKIKSGTIKNRNRRIDQMDRNLMDHNLGGEWEESAVISRAFAVIPSEPATNAR